MYDHSYAVLTSVQGIPNSYICKIANRCAKQCYLHVRIYIRKYISGEAELCGTYNAATDKKCQCFFT